MKSVGEAMAIGRTFPESLQKALRSLETGLQGLDEIEIEGLGKGDDRNAIKAALGTPDAGPPAEGRPGPAARRQPRRGLCQLQDRPLVPGAIAGHRRSGSQGEGARRSRDAGAFRHLKAMGFSDARLAVLTPHHRRSRCERCAVRSTCGRSSSASIPARPSSPRRPPTCTRPIRRRSPACRPTRRVPRTPGRSSSSAAARTGSARASSSIIAAAMPASRSRMRATRPSWSIAIRRPSRPITTPRTGSISSRSPKRMCWRSSRPSARTARCTASSCSSAARRR